MIGKILDILTGRVVSRVFDIIERAQARKAKREVLEAELREAVADAMRDYGEAVIAARRDVILAEAKGDNWLQRNWRPLVAVSFAFVLLFYGLFLPIAVDWFGLPPVRVGDALLGWIMTSVNIAIGGYIGGRSLEKIAKVLAWRK